MRAPRAIFRVLQRSTRSLLNVRHQWSESSTRFWHLVRRLRAHRRVVLFVVCLALMSDTMIYGVVVPVLPTYVTNRLHLSESALGFLFAVYAVALVIATPIIGIWADKHGRRTPMVLGMFALAVTTLTFAWATNFAELVLARFAQGLSAAVTWVVGFAMLADVYRHNELGTATGVATASLNFGLLAGPMVGGIMYEHLGFGAPFYLCAGLAFIDTVFRILLIDDAEIQRNARLVRQVPIATLQASDAEIARREREAMELEQKQQEPFTGVSPPSVQSPSSGGATGFSAAAHLPLLSNDGVSVPSFDKVPRPESLRRVTFVDDSEAEVVSGSSADADDELSNTGAAPLAPQSEGPDSKHAHHLQFIGAADPFSVVVEGASQGVAQPVDHAGVSSEQYPTAVPQNDTALSGTIAAVYPAEGLNVDRSAHIAFIDGSDDDHKQPEGLLGNEASSSTAVSLPPKLNRPRAPMLKDCVGPRNDLDEDLIVDADADADLDGRDQPGAATPTVDQRATFWSLIRGRKVIVMCLHTVSLAASYSALEPTIAPFLAERYNSSPTVLGAVYVVIFLANLSAALPTGYLSDRPHLGRKMFAESGVLVMIIFGPLMALPENIYLTSLMAMVYGIGYGMGMTPAVPLLAKFVDEQGGGAYGTVYALWNMAYAVGMCVGPMLGGVVYEFAGFFWMNVVFSLILLLFWPALHFFLPSDKMPRGVIAPETDAELLELGQAVTPHIPAAAANAEHAAAGAVNPAA